MESPIFFCFPFKEQICYLKRLEITRRSMEAMKKENFCPLKKKCPYITVWVKQTNRCWKSLSKHINLINFKQILTNKRFYTKNKTDFDDKYFSCLFINVVLWCTLEKWIVIYTLVRITIIFSREGDKTYTHFFILLFIFSFHNKGKCFLGSNTMIIAMHESEIATRVFEREN